MRRCGSPRVNAFAAAHTVRRPVASVADKLCAFDDPARTEAWPPSAELLGTTITFKCHGSRFDVTTERSSTVPRLSHSASTKRSDVNGEIQARI